MQKETIQKLVKEESLRKTIQLVFDKQTINALHSLAKKGYFDFLEFLISPGKEALVFRAQAGEEFKAVKIYKIKTSSFRQMQQYIEGDRRFEKVKRTKQEIIFAWAKKESKNLHRFYEAGVRVPIPIAVKENVLVMEFVGEKGKAAKTLKEEPIKDLGRLYERIVEYLALMIAKAGLVHADLSEYNMLNLNEEPIIIDCGQAVLLSHPHAKEFFERDVRNMSNYFSKRGLKKGFKGMYEEVKERIETIKREK